MIDRMFFETGAFFVVDDEDVIVVVVIVAEFVVVVGVNTLFIISSKILFESDKHGPPRH